MERLRLSPPSPTPSFRATPATRGKHRTPQPYIPRFTNTGAQSARVNRSASPRATTSRHAPRNPPSAPSRASLPEITRAAPIASVRSDAPVALHSSDAPVNFSLKSVVDQQAKLADLISALQYELKGSTKSTSSTTKKIGEVARVQDGLQEQVATLSTLVADMRETLENFTRAQTPDSDEEEGIDKGANAKGKQRDNAEAVRHSPLEHRWFLSRVPSENAPKSR